MSDLQEGVENALNIFPNYCKGNIQQLLRVNSRRDKKYTEGKRSLSNFSAHRWHSCLDQENVHASCICAVANLETSTLTLTVRRGYKNTQTLIKTSVTRPCVRISA